MIQLLKMALRDIGRNRRRSFLSALALGMGLGLLMLMAAFIEGEMRGAMESSIRLQSGHFQVRAATYDENKTSLNWDNLLDDPAGLSARIAAIPGVAAATPRLFASGLVAEGKETAAVRIYGIDPGSIANDPYRAGLVSGRFLSPDDREGVLLGQSLAEKLRLAAGDRLYLMVNTSTGDVAEQEFTIRGVYSTGIPAFDQSTIFMPLTKAQDIAQAGERASTIFVLLGNRERIAEVMAALPTAEASGYQVQTYEQANEVLAQTEQMSAAYMKILHLIVLGVTATVIVNALVMAVFERTREIGILAAMGMKPGRIMAMFFAESSLLALGGILIGLVIGALLAAYATYVGFYIGDLGITGMLLGERIYGYLTVEDTLSLTAMAFVVTLLGSLYPALLAARLEPVEALRGGK
jgi:ABC-type lipoprotein release transport system permease subunit